jgi:hypothetical protein
MNKINLKEYPPCEIDRKAEVQSWAEEGKARERRRSLYLGTLYGMVLFTYLGTVLCSVFKVFVVFEVFDVTILYLVQVVGCLR